MASKRSYHFIGIGGIGMSGIAELLLTAGHQVSGSDASASALTRRLSQHGAKVYTGHAAEQVPADTTVVYSTAIAATNPEYRRAQELGLPLVRRGQMLAELMRGGTGIAVAGSHGKTTTTGALATMAIAAGKDPSFLIGGTVATLGGNARLGDGEFFIAEADESDASFLLLSPRHAIITNIDDDHLDHYGSRDKIEAAFGEFARLIPDAGVLVLNADDPGCSRLLAHFPKAVSFSLTSADASYRATDVKFSATGTSFRLRHGTSDLGVVETGLIGGHNLSNVLGALALALELGWELPVIRSALPAFRGVDRRQQRLLERGEFLVMDDYGHHPTEIRATIRALKAVDPRPLTVVFEPHRFTRTQNFWDEFLSAFDAADEVFIAAIYPASEPPLSGVDSERLVNEMRARGVRVSYLPELRTGLEALIESYQTQPRILLTMGAGPISGKVRELLGNT